MTRCFPGRRTAGFHAADTLLEQKGPQSERERERARERERERQGATRLDLGVLGRPGRSCHVKYFRCA